VAIYDRRKNFPLFSLPELPKRADVDRVRGVFLDHEFACRVEKTSEWRLTNALGNA